MQLFTDVYRAYIETDNGRVYGTAVQQTTRPDGRINFWYFIRDDGYPIESMKADGSWDHEPHGYERQGAFNVVHYEPN